MRFLWVPDLAQRSDFLRARRVSKLARGGVLVRRSTRLRLDIGLSFLKEQKGSAERFRAQSKAQSLDNRNRFWFVDGYETDGTKQIRGSIVQC